jgi:hypothetical protein
MKKPRDKMHRGDRDCPPMVCIGVLEIDGQFLRGDEWFPNGSGG